MKIRYMSDLHLEMSTTQFMLPKIEDEENTVLVLAGDIAVVEHARSFDYLLTFIEDVCSRHLEVIWVLGNHEHYHGNVSESKALLEKDFNYIENLRIVDEVTSFALDGVYFVCGTMWFDAPLSTHLHLATYMNDFHVCKISDPELGERRFTPQIASSMGKEARNRIFDLIEEEISGENRPIVVVTHHAPSKLSTDPVYYADPSTEGYYQGLDGVLNSMVDNYPVLWIHGHTHMCVDYYIGKVRVVSNARGYIGQYNNPVEGFDPTTCIDVKTKDYPEHPYFDEKIK